MASKVIGFNWQNSIAITTAIVAVLAAATSLRVNSTSSALLLEKNNANNYQSKANKEWNNYLANNIVDRALERPSNLTTQQGFKNKAESLEQQADEAATKADTYFEKNSRLTTSGTFFEIAIALLAMSTLIKKKLVWVFSLLLEAAGGYFLLLGIL